MSTWLDGVINDLDAEVLVRALAKKGWSEKNFQVCVLIVWFAFAVLKGFRCHPKYMECVPPCPSGVLHLEGLA